MLGWLCLLGWLLLITFIAYAGAFCGDFMSAWGNAWGWPTEKPTNWKAFNIKLFVFWAISIILKVLIWGWW